MKRATKFLCVVGFLTALMLGKTMAMDTAVITGNECRGKSGETVEFTVEIEQNTGIAGFMFYIQCDTDVFSLEWDDGVESYHIEPGDVTRSGTLTCAAYGTDGWKVTWYQPQNTVQDGKLFTLRFTIAAGTPIGDYPIKVTYSRANTVDENGVRVPLSVKARSIRVLPHEASFTTEVNTASAPGNQIELSVMIEKNPGIVAFVIYIDCDTKSFSLIQNEESGNYLIEPGAFSDGGTWIANTNGERGFRIIWYHNVNAYDSGTLFTLPITVLESASMGEYTFDVRVSEIDLTDVTGQKIPIESVSNASVLLKHIEIASASLRIDGNSGRAEVVVNTKFIHTSNPVLLCVASYTYGGRMMEIVMQPVVGSGGADQLVISLAKRLHKDASVKIFVLSSDSFAPVYYPWVLSDPAECEYKEVIKE